MKSPALFAFAACLALSPAATGARAQFPNFPAADRVLGAPDFTTPGNGAATAAAFAFPAGLAIDPTTGKLFVASRAQHRILRFPDATTLANGANAEAVFGQINFSGVAPGSTATKLDSLFGIHLDRTGRLWVADTDNNRVLMFIGASTLPGFGATPDLVLGQPDFTTTSPGTTGAKMGFPVAICVDAADNLWVADFGNNRVLKFAAVSTLANGAAATSVFGQILFTTSASATTVAAMDSPNAVAVDGAGRLWVADQQNRRVLRFDNAASLGNGSTASGVLGQPDFTTNTPGTTAQTMIQPSAVLVDPAGTLYVSDLANRRVLFFKNAAGKPNGAAADGVIGQPDFTTSSAATTARKLNGPNTGLAMDGAGRLWVSDYLGYRVLRFSPDRTATPPKIKGRVPKTTSASKLTLRGTATDPSGVVAVRYRVGKGAFKNAVGTTTWKLSAKLKPGKNTIQIVTVDGAGNTSAAKRVIVKRL